jgi:uncharacterized Zn finger protein
VKSASAPRRFATTWWGTVWITALEQRARLDPNRLPRGRTYARHGHVRDLTLGAGEITAMVQGSRRTPYRVRVRLRTFTRREWETVFTAISARAAHAAALLDGELDPGIVDEAAAASVDLLPGPGELQPRCSCPDWADPCKHSAAVCYLTAQALDRDPFGLFLLRGLGRDAVLDGVRRRRAGGATVGGDAGGPSERRDDGIPASAAWRSSPGPRPVRPRPPARPAIVAPLPPLPSSAPAAPNVAILDTLAADAIERAWRARVEGVPIGLDLTVEQDLARYAASVLDRGGIDDLAIRSGRRGRELVRLALAWRNGGARGVDLVVGAERPSAGADELAEVRAAAAEVPEVARLIGLRDGWVTIGRGARLGRAPDGRWYRLDRVGRLWELRQAPADDPAELLEDRDDGSG